MDNRDLGPACGYLIGMVIAVVIIWSPIIIVVWEGLK